MAYTVQQLAKLSGVSSRTLRFYDEIGLLKPAYYGSDNNYRYYEIDQLLMLQQILFYRELGFPLADIGKIIGASDFDKIKALNSHKIILEQNINQTEKLINTIDKTLAYLKGETTMRNVELFEGFDPKAQAKFEDYLVKQGITTQSELDKSWGNIKNWSKEDYEQYKQRWVRVDHGLRAAMKNNVPVDTEEVQNLVREHYDMVKVFWTPDRNSYIGLGSMYCEGTELGRYYDEVFGKYLFEAMKIFANKELS
jgi:DNA-binding transcriptional MerR regulator